MHTHEIPKNEFLETFKNGMGPLPEIGDGKIDIWEYVSALVEQHIVPNTVFDNNEVIDAYRSLDNKYDHVIVQTIDEQKFAVLVIDLERQAVIGHSILDIANEYGL